MSRADLPSEAGGTTASVFAALGHATRLDLLSHLSDGREHSISALTGQGDLTRQAVTKHLRVLKEAGLVDHRRVGRESRFTLRPHSLARAQDYLTRVSAQWDAAIARLRNAVES